MFYTLIDQTDGFGSQYQKIIYSILFAEHKNGIYLYNPIKKIEHCDVSFINKIEELINIKNNYMNIKYIDYGVDMKVIGIYEAIEYFESNIDKFLNSDSFKKIKDCFWKNKDKNFFKNNKLNISVHIRRPNQYDTRIDGTDTPLSYYFNIIEYIRNKYKNKECEFHIYSENNITDYTTSGYDTQDFVYHLNESIIETFIGMVASDILITSKSSLSYTAALLSDGEIYYIPFWHPPSKRWIVF